MSVSEALVRAATMASPSAWTSPGKQATLLTHLVMRDDAMHLYGFASESERELFLMLVGVQSVGPKVALAVLSGGAPRELLNAIATGDTARFQAVPGIGKRTAERIIVELREKVSVADNPVAGVPGGIVARRGHGPRGLAREGLLELGYAPGEAEELLRDIEGDTAEELLAQALRTARRA